MWTNRMKFGKNRAPGAPMIAQTVNLQSRVRPLCHACPSLSFWPYLLLIFPFITLSFWFCLNCFLIFPFITFFSSPVSLCISSATICIVYLVDGRGRIIFDTSILIASTTLPSSSWTSDGISISLSPWRPCSSLIHWPTYCLLTESNG